jgi:hypothetical protein
MATNDTISAAQQRMFVIGHSPYVAGDWHAPFMAQIGAGAALTSGVIRLVPFLIPRPVTISNLGCRITTLAGSGKIKLAYYASDAAGVPTGTPVVSTGDIATDTAADASAAVTTTATAQPGLHWMAAWADNATVVLQVANGATTIGGFASGSPTLANITNASNNAAYQRNWTLAYGAWPDLTGQSTTETAGSNAWGVVFFKAA